MKQKSQRFSWKSFLLPFALFIFTFCVYLHNLSQSVYGGDVGDLLSAIVVKGVAHPSGYPFFIILGIFANSIPVMMTTAGKVGLVSVFFSSVSVVIFYFTVLLLTQKKYISFISALTLAFFYMFWLYAEIAEVFALASFFVEILVFLALLYYKKRKTVYLYFFSFFLGVSLTHHEIIIATFPSLFFIILATKWKIIREWKTILFCILFGALGLFPFLYIPLAASGHPIINWDNATTLQNFFKLILRKDYGWGAASSYDIFFRFLVVKDYLVKMFFELTPAGSVIVLLGMFSMIRKKMYILFCSFFLGFFLLGPVYVVYGLTPLLSGFIMGVLERFYMLSSLFLFFFFPLGILFISETLATFLVSLSQNKSRKSLYVFLFSSVFIIIPLTLFRFNFSKTNLSTVWLGDTLAEDLLSSLPQHSILALEGDTIFFNTEYVQIAKGFRKDIMLVNLNGIQASAALTKEAKARMQKDKKLTEEIAYLESLIDFGKKQSVFSSVGFQFKDKKYGQLSWVPYGIVYKLQSTSGMPNENDYLTQQEKLWQTFHDPVTVLQNNPSSHGLTLTDIPITYAKGLINTGNYLLNSYGDSKEAKKYFARSIQESSFIDAGYMGLGYASLAQHNCREAADAFTNAIIINPANKTAYVLLYGVYTTCSRDVLGATAVLRKFQAIFHDSLINEAKKQYQSSTSK